MSPGRNRSRIGATALLACVLATGGGCGRDSGPARAPADAADVVDELCQAAEAARGGDAAQARDGFHDVHGALHALAEDHEATERAATARLLRAKQAVEAGLEEAPPEELAGELEALAAAAAEVTGARRRGCA